MGIIPLDVIASSAPSAPDYAIHRKDVAAVDTLPETEELHGMNMQGFEVAHIQVIPSGGADPDVEVLYWSPQAGEFIVVDPADTRTGAGVDTPYEFTVQVRGRLIFVAVTTLAAGQVDRILVSGQELDHLR